MISGKGDWCKPLLDHFEVGLEKLPQLIRPWEKLGTVRPKLAKEFLLNGEIPVAAGSCDGSTAILGAGGVNEKTAVSVMGTTDVLFLVAKDWKAKENSGLIINPHVIPGYWLIGGPMGMYGGTVEWFRKSIMGESKSLDELNRLAAELEPGCFGLTVLPNLAGENALLECLLRWNIGRSDGRASRRTYLPWDFGGKWLRLPGDTRARRQNGS